MPTDLITAVSSLEEADALAIVRQRLEEGDSPLAILDDAKTGLVVVGDRFQEGTYFIPELVFAGEIIKAVVELVKPHIPAIPDSKKRGRVLIGTVQGDIHDIGKNIVVFLLDANGFEVHDLGVDVPPEVFVENIQKLHPAVVGLSGFLTISYDSMRTTVEAITAAGLREDVKIIIGGGTVDEAVRRHSGADAYGRLAGDAVTFATQWTGGE